jgi:hypothetical protein
MDWTDFSLSYQTDQSPEDVTPDRLESVLPENQAPHTSFHGWPDTSDRWIVPGGHMRGFLILGARLGTLDQVEE